MDDADFAAKKEAEALERAVQAARGQVPTEDAFRTSCRICSETLATTRRQYGICVECQSDVERWERGLA